MELFVVNRHRAEMPWSIVRDELVKIGGIASGKVIGCRVNRVLLRGAEDETGEKTTSPFGRLKDDSGHVSTAGATQSDADGGVGEAGAVYHPHAARDRLEFLESASHCHWKHIAHSRAVRKAQQRSLGWLEGMMTHALYLHCFVANAV